MSMNEHTENFHVMIDQKGRPTVKLTHSEGPSDSVIFNKETLLHELEGLFKRAANTGYQIGRQEVRDKFCDIMGLKRWKS